MTLDWLSQSASLIGLWGLTFIAIAVYASPAVLADDTADTRHRWLAPALGVVVVAAMAVYGAVRLNRTPTTFVDNVRLRVMQPNLQQDDKFRYSQKQAVMARYIALSDRASGPQSSGIADVTHLIWPESAFPFFLTREADALAQIAALLPEGTVLITGAARAPEIDADRAHPCVLTIRSMSSITTARCFRSTTRCISFRSASICRFRIFSRGSGLLQLTKVKGGFIPGDRRRIMAVPRAPSFLPLVCYEIIFPGDAVPAGERAGWMLNLTNDGWFGMSAGPYQHFQQARLRAIEEGLPLVRVANTGISAVVDPLGRIVRALPLGSEGVLDSLLPRPIPRTIYARAGDAPAGLIVIAAFLLVIHSRRRARVRGA